jgi:Cu-processing system permease protein
MRMVPVISSTFRESLRERSLAVLLVYLVVMPLGALAGGYVAVGLELKILIDLGLSLLTLLGMVLAIFHGTGLARVEIERQVVTFILARPLRRATLIVGKYAGLALTLLLATVAMGVILSAGVLAIGGISRAAALWPVVGLIYLELLVVLALALFFSTFTSQVLAMVLTLLLTLLGRSVPELAGIAATAANPLVRGLFRALYFLIPDLAIFNRVAEAGYGRSIDLVLGGGLILQAVVMVAMILAAAVIVFERRDLP